MRMSVIIPAYNSSDTIIQSIKSVYAQENIDEISFEVVVVDDGSTDNTYELVLEYVERFNISNLYVYQKQNEGVSKARNFGIDKSTGEWIAFLDSDDVWLPNKLSRQFGFINTDKDIDFIGCARNNEKLRILGRPINQIYKAKVFDLLIKMFPQTSTSMVKKRLLEKTGLYNECMTHAEDGELWVRLCYNGNFFYMPESLVITGGGKENFGQKGLSSNLKKMHEGTIQMLKIAKDKGIISNSTFYIFYAFYFFKYIRRVFLVKLRE